MLASNRKLVRVLAVVAFCIAGLAVGDNSAGCDRISGLTLLCGQQNPEDIVRIPGTRWLIASGFNDGAGFKLVDTTAKSLHGVTIDTLHGESEAGTNCKGPPDLERLNIQGLSLRAASNHQHRLYAVNHGGREAIEVLQVDADPDVPRLIWKSCVAMPESLAANSVASYSDGTILATVLVHAGDTYADFVEGRDTGGVYEWRPGGDGFELIPGTELPGNNGIETDRDDSGFYVVAFGTHAVLRFSRNEPESAPRESVAPGFMPDNVHWDNERLIAAGMMYDEPACGGVRRVIDGVADPMRCHRGTVVAELDPESMAWRVIAYGPPDRKFNGASSARIVGNELWIGSYQSECLAYQALPGGG